MSKAKPGDVVEVRWADSESVVLGWETPAAYIEAALRPNVYRTAGYLLHRGRQRVIVALSVDVGGHRITNTMSIPTSQVRRLRVLGRGSRAVRKAMAR